MKHPITMDSAEANRVLAHSSASLGPLVGMLTVEILKKNPTLDEAQAVLVKTWDSVLLNAKLTILQKQEEKECTGR